METADNLSLRVASFSYYLDTAKDHSLLHRPVSSQETTNNPILMTSSSNPTMIKPPFTIKFSKPKEISQLDHTARNNLRTDSFSYRNTSADNKNFVFENPGPVKDPTSSFAFSQPNNKDGEIGVFGADRYFNMKLEYKTEPAKKNNNTRGPENPARVGSNVPVIGPRTPSLSSEASSAYNYQTALLPAGGGGRDLHRYGSSDQAAKHNNKRAIGRRIFNGFGCKGPCFDKKSIHINEAVPDGSSSLYGPKPARNGSERITIPAIKPVDKNPTANINKNNSTIKVVQDDLDELSRNSIEVFGSSTQSTKGEVATNMERKLSMLTWDAIPINNKGQLFTPPPAKSTTTLGSSTIICDNADMASEASSDLFEIENISGSSVFPLILTSSSSELLPREDQMSPRISHYAPSEASIQWSVVTASAADYSIISDYNNNNINDEMTSVSVAGDLVTRAVKTKGGGQGGKSEGQKSRPAGGLLGCKSDKSVDVAENVLCHKANEKVLKNVGPDLNVSFGKSGRVKDMDHALKSPRSLPMVI